jgi:hypothetical protein
MPFYIIVFVVIGFVIWMITPKIKRMMLILGMY